VTCNRYHWPCPSTGYGPKVASTAPYFPIMSSLSIKDSCLGIKLSYSNATSWFIRVEMLLRAKSCFKAVEDDTVNAKEKATAMFILSVNVDDDLLHLMDPSGSPKAVWEALKEQFQGVSASRQVHLSSILSSLKKSTEESLEDFIARCSLLKNELTTAKLYEATQFRIRFLEALQPEFDNWVLSMRTQAQLPTFEVLIENLRSIYYSKLQSSDSQGSVPGAYAAGNSQPARQTCQYCNKPGHSILRCFKLRRDQEKDKNDYPGAGGRQQRGGRRGRGRGNGAGRSGAHGVSAFICTIAGRASGSREQLSDRWMVDSGSTDHMVNNVQLLHNVRPLTSECNLAAKQAKVPVKAVGDVRLQNHVGEIVTLQNALYVPDLSCNLISAPRADDAGLEIVSKCGKLSICDDSKVLLVAHRNSQMDGSLYYADCTPEYSAVAPAQAQAAASPGVPSSSSKNVVLWHRRLAHTGYSTIAHMSRRCVVKGLPAATLFEQQLKSTSVCAPCAVSKAARVPFPASDARASQPLERLHADIAGPFATSAGGARYFTVIVDDYSGFKIVAVHSKKSESAQLVENTILQMQRKYKLPVGSLRTDRDSVYMSKRFQDFLTKEGIEHQPSSGYSPQENGHAERAIRTLTEARDALLADSGLATKFWGDALMHATYVKNLCSSSADSSPFELFRGFKPDVTNLRVFGCACYVRIPSEHRKKSALPRKAQLGKFLGFAQPNFKAYRVLLPSGKVLISRDVDFDESAAPAVVATAPDFGDLVEAQTSPPSVPAPPAPCTAVLADPLMVDNPVFEEGGDDVKEAEEEAVPMTPRRNPTRQRAPPSNPYQKYLGPSARAVNFRL
jgi:transposase InsO family protein